MNNELIPLLNPTKILEEKLPLIIEVFVSYYGEDLRDEITKKFSEATIIGYQSIDDTKIILQKIKENQEDLLLKNLFSKYNLELNKDTKQKFLGYGKIGDKNTIIDKCGMLIIKQHLGKEGRHQQFIKQNFERLKIYSPDLTLDDMLKYSKNGIPEKILNSIPDVMKEDINYYFDINENAEDQFKKEINTCLPLINMLMPDVNVENFSLKDTQVLNCIYQEYLKSVDEYQKYMEQFQIYQDEIDFAQNLKHNLDKKYMIHLIDELIDLFPVSTQEKWNIEKKKDIVSLYNLPEISATIGHNLIDTPMVESFSHENETIMMDNKNNWREQTIINNRVSYFKKIGINLGENYKTYLDSQECHTVWPQQEIIERILQTKQKYANMFSQEYYGSLPRYKAVKNKIDSLNLLDKDIVFTTQIYENPVTCVNPNIKQKMDGTIEEKNLIFVNSSWRDEYFDKNIIHEFNHLWELNLTDISENSYKEISGWDILHGTLNQNTINENNNNDPKRNYELFNEIINETLAQEISSLMHQKGIYLFNSKESCRDFGGTGYQKSFVLVKEFMELYKPLIIESRKHGNIEIILNAVGKDNFDALNNLVNKFNQIFSEFTFYQMISDINENRDTNLTQMYNQIIKEKDEIMNQIQIYSNSKAL